VAPNASKGAGVGADPIHVKISGKWYDVSDWADSHPGGRYSLEWADGFDVTGAFHTTHLFSSQKAGAILAKLPEADLTVRRRPAGVQTPIKRVAGHGEPTGMDKFMNVGESFIQRASPTALDAARRICPPVVPASGLAWQSQPQQAAQKHEAEGAMEAANSSWVVGESALKRDLEAMLRRRFKSRADYKATPEHWARILGALALWAVSLAGWVRGSTPETLMLPFAQWLLFSPTVHEASHSTLSTIPWMNKAASFCGLPFVYNPYIWWIQHIMNHHQYTNDDALDVDLHHLRPARLHPGLEVDDSASGFNFLFKGYFSTMGMAALWPIRNLQQKTTGRWYENLITPKPAAVGDVEFALSMLPVAFVLVWPPILLLAHIASAGELGVNAIHSFMLWLYPWATSGAIWTVMTQVSHVQEKCQRPPTGSQDDYFRWQIESALDYSVCSSLVPKLTASLSLQSIHHVMPSVCGCHFHRLYSEFTEICERHGVRLNTAKDLSAAWRSCIEHVFELSSPAVTPEWAVREPSEADKHFAEHFPLAAYLLSPAVAFLLLSPFY